MNDQNPQGGWPNPEDPTVVTPQFQRPAPPPPQQAQPAAGWGQPPTPNPATPHSSWGTQPQPPGAGTPPAPAQSWAGSQQPLAAGAPAQGWASPPPQGWAGAPAGTGAKPPAAGRRRKLIIAAVAAVVLVVTAVVAVPRLFGGASSMTAAETVTAYLEALAAGDAEKALSFSKSEPANADLLTSEVLSKQIAKMPISDIRILDDGEDMAGIGMAMVKVAVKFGDKLSDSTVRLSKVEETWKIDEAINKIEILSPNAADETLTLFGKELTKGEAFYVFPGFVEVGSSNEYIGVTADSPLLTGAMLSFRPTYELNDDGAEAVSTAVADAFAECEKSRLLNPPACPVKLNEYSAVDGTVTWGKSDLSGVSIGELSPYDLTVRLSGKVATPVSFQTRDGGTDSGTAESSLYNSVDVSTSPPTIGR